MVGGPQPRPHHPLVQPKVARILVLLQVITIRFVLGVESRLVIRFRFVLGTESRLEPVSETRLYFLRVGLSAKLFLLYVSASPEINKSSEFRLLLSIRLSN